MATQIEDIPLDKQDKWGPLCHRIIDPKKDGYLFNILA